MNKLVKALLNKQQGQTFPLVLIILAIGSVLVSGFLTSANTSLLNAKVYSDPISDTYAADAGIEDAIWGLQYSTLGKTLDSSGGFLEYVLHESVNDLPVYITLNGIMLVTITKRCRVVFIFIILRQFVSIKLFRQ